MRLSNVIKSKTVKFKDCVFYSRVNRKNDFDIINREVSSIQKSLVECTFKNDAHTDALVQKGVNKHACILSDNCRTNVNMRMTAQAQLRFPLSRTVRIIWVKTVHILHVKMVICVLLL